MSETNYDPTFSSEQNSARSEFEAKPAKRVVRRGTLRKAENPEPQNLEAAPEPLEVSEDHSAKKRRGRPKKVSQGSGGELFEKSNADMLFSSDRDDVMLDSPPKDSDHTIIPHHYENSFSPGSEANHERVEPEGMQEEISDRRYPDSSSEGRVSESTSSAVEGQSQPRDQRSEYGGNRRPHTHGNHPGGKFKKHFKFNKQDKKPLHQQGQHPNPNHKKFNKQHDKHEKPVRRWGNQQSVGQEGPNFGDLGSWEVWYDSVGLEELVKKVTEGNKEALQLNQLYAMPLLELAEFAKARGIQLEGSPNRIRLVTEMIKQAYLENTPSVVKGVIEILHSGHGLILYQHDNYKHKALSTFVHKSFVKKFGLKYGHIVEAIVYPPREEETCPSAIQLLNVMGQAPESIANIVPFADLVPYYPTERIMLETKPGVAWDNLSMRVVDLLTPIGLGQRGLIVAPPRTGKTVLMQSMANAILVNKPNAHLIVLLLDERPEEVTDFKRQVNAEVIASTFDETPESHVHAAEVVINKARRMVEVGQHVIILLDSITRLARAYNTMMPSSGKILSGGVEANALQWPKRFFGSARNIEGGGSLTIFGTALIETGSRMDEVIFEEFKGTGNMELNLDRSLSDKRIFPAINLERSGTRKEELLYHPEEMAKVYSLRRAMKGIPSTEAMEMMIQRIRKTKSNAEFLMALNS